MREPKLLLRNSSSHSAYNAGSVVIERCHAASFVFVASSTASGQFSMSHAAS